MRTSRAIGRALRRWLGRNETVVRWLGLSRSHGTADKPGLILIQIDALSRAQLEKAIRRRRMPFLRKLIRKRGYRLHTMYSGMPSSTPAVQAEIFYGVKCAVPAFSFRDPQSGQILRMFDSTAAAKVQARLEQQGDGLLAGGSAYSNIYSGGAAEPHFCAATMGWGTVLAVNPLTLASIVFWHCWSIIRTAALMAVEFGLALGDFIRGEIKTKELGRELKFVPARVFLNVGLRELITIGASMDATRGLPVIQLNYIGYDEQAHRRGPSSLFAHWSLMGIDDAIKRVVTAARQSQRRKYSVWIYSDHGQERTVPYSEKFGRSLHEAVSEIFGEHVESASISRDKSANGEEYGRIKWVGQKVPRRRGKPVQHEAVAAPPAHTADKPNTVQVESMGPVGHIYPPEPLERERLDEIARALAGRAGVPLVLSASEDDRARVWTAEGEFELPRDAQAVFGPDHPFLDAMVRDLICLCHHPSAGQLVVCGWQRKGVPLSFAVENGSHAGPGPEETGAFVLAPADAPLPNDVHWFRPSDLRRAALHELGRAAQDPKPLLETNGEAVDLVRKTPLPELDPMPSADPAVSGR